MAEYWVLIDQGGMVALTMVIGAAAEAIKEKPREYQMVFV